MSIDALYLGNDTILEVSKLVNAATGAYVNDASVTATLKDAAGVTVAGQSFPMTLSYAGDALGTYRGTLQDTLAISENQWYTGEITAIGGGLTGFWRHRMMAKRRT